MQFSLSLCGAKSLVTQFPFFRRQRYNAVIVYHRTAYSSGFLVIRHALHCAFSLVSSCLFPCLIKCRALNFWNVLCFLLKKSSPPTAFSSLCAQSFPIVLPITISNIERPEVSWGTSKTENPVGKKSIQCIYSNIHISLYEYICQLKCHSKSFPFVAWQRH